MVASIAEIEGRLRGTEHEARTAINRMDAHEDICALRYAGIIDTHNELKKDIAKVNNWLLTIGLLLLSGMATILVKLQFFNGG